MSSLGVVPDFIASFHSNPLRNGTILLLFLGQESLDPESLVRRHGEERTQPHIGWWRREERFCFFLLSTALLSGTTGCSRIIWYVSYPSPRSAISPRIPSSFPWRMEDLGGSWTYWYSGAYFVLDFGSVSFVPVFPQHLSSPVSITYLSSH